MSDYIKDMFIEVREKTKDTAVDAKLLMVMIGIQVINLLLSKLMLLV